MFVFLKLEEEEDLEELKHGESRHNAQHWMYSFLIQNALKLNDDLWLVVEHGLLHKSLSLIVIMLTFVVIKTNN